MLRFGLQLNPVPECCVDPCVKTFVSFCISIAYVLCTWQRTLEHMHLLIYTQFCSGACTVHLHCLDVHDTVLTVPACGNYSKTTVVGVGGVKPPEIRNHLCQLWRDMHSQENSVNVIEYLSIGC